MNKHLLALSSVSLLFSSACMAFGLAAAGHQERASFTGAQWPVIVNDHNEYLGLFGGISSGYNQDGVLESAMLLVSPAGYITPILNSGEIATLPVTFFQHKNCAGHEFLPATSTQHQLLPYRGMVYRSLSSNDLIYIPKQSHSSTIKTKSRFKFGPGGLPECEETVEETEAYKAIRNSPELTGIDIDNSYDSATFSVYDQRSVSRRPGILSGSKTRAGIDKPYIPDAAYAIQEECSAACISSSSGDGSCDIECYVESCFYDKGDCDNLPPEELQRLLSEVCSPGCDTIDIGDGFCDKHCDTQACQYDGGDCEQQ